MRSLYLLGLFLVGCATPADDSGAACEHCRDVATDDTDLADAGLGDELDAGDGGPVAPPPPANLADTGLCTNPACTTIASGVVEFRPRWALWSDGASKRRWIALPPGTQIDTTDMDYWRYPTGTKLWKEFVRDGVRVETRYMVKMAGGDAAWSFVAYAWNAEQTLALPIPAGRANVLGTGHDIPSQETCLGCHANVKTRVLGFTAFQLDWNAPAPLADLDDALARGWLTGAPPGSVSPHLPLPGSAQVQATLGYLHANCGHCHHADSPLVNRPMFRLEAARISSVGITRTYQSSVNVPGTAFGGATIVAKPRDPDHSIIITRMNAADPKKRMPALGAETIDVTGRSLLRTWITNL